MTINREKVTAQAVADLRSRLADQAIVWARAIEKEASLDERPPMRESNVKFRVAATRAQQEIRRLVSALDHVHNKG